MWENCIQIPFQIKKIVEKLGLLRYLVAGDLILADKGFLINDIVPHGVSVNIPPFLPVASSSTTPKKPRLGSGGRNECLAWFKDYAEQKCVEQEAPREKAEKHHRDKMELLSGILGVLKDLNKWIPALETGFYFARQFLNNILLIMDYKVANVQQVTFICWNLLTDILKYYFKTKDIYYMLFIYLKWTVYKVHVNARYKMILYYLLLKDNF